MAVFAYPFDSNRVQVVRASRQQDHRSIGVELLRKSDGTVDGCVTESIRKEILPVAVAVLQEVLTMPAVGDHAVDIDEYTRSGRYWLSGPCPVLWGFHYETLPGEDAAIDR